MKTATDASLIIDPVRGAGDLRHFLTLTKKLYRDDPAWVAPLDFMERRRFAPTNHFFQHARWQGWVASRAGQPVGRITAQVDEQYQRHYRSALGYFGMLEAEDDPAVFAALFAAAETWLREQGIQRVRGPYNLHINEEVGLLVEGFATPPFVLMGHARDWYGGRVEGCGYTPVKDLLAYRLRPDFAAPAVMSRLVQRLSRQLRVRPLRRRALARDAAIMRQIFNDAWQNNWGFVPLEPAQWLETVKTLTALMPRDYIQIAEYAGEPVAFAAALPNLNEAARDLHGKLLPWGWAKLLWRLKVTQPRSARVPLMGVKRAFQHSRLGPALAFAVIDTLRQALHAHGVETVEISWILADNKGARNIVETIGGSAYKRYRLYEKPLSARR